MEMPLDSLDWLAWKVFADWCLDHGRTKQHCFARRAAKGLLACATKGDTPQLILVASPRQAPDWLVPVLPASLSGDVFRWSGYSPANPAVPRWRMHLSPSSAKWISFRR